MPTTHTSIAQIQAINPPLDAHLTFYMLENFGASLKLQSAYGVEELRVQLWTNAVNKFNSEGAWHSIDLNFVEASTDHYLFAGSFRPTSEGDYQYTYRVGLHSQPQQWQWLGKFGANGHLHVKPPSRNMEWTQGASLVEILPCVYVGNFIAASSAAELEVDAVLNLAEELHLTFPEDGEITYRKLGTKDGAQHPISEEILQSAIAWIDEQIAQGKKKILVHCRAGIGRSGSTGVAYCFYKNPTWSYQQALEYAWSKKADIYPHTQLQASLERLFPRS